MRTLPFLCLLLLLTVPTCGASAAVVAELFESQGCSSCPPAEKTLAALKREFGEGLIPLVCHVDYWDSLGWKDTFSLPACTRRQQAYTQHFRERTPYTPQLVIQGAVGFVGSDAARATAEIRQRVERTRSLSLRYRQEGPAALAERTLSFEVPVLPAPVQTVTLVFYHHAPSVRVRRGENAGVEMSGRWVVAGFREIPSQRSGVYEIRLSAADLPGMDAGVVALVEGRDGQILAAGGIPLYR